MTIGAPRGHRRYSPIKHMGAEVQISAACPSAMWLELESEARRCNCSKSKIIIQALEIELERRRETLNGTRP